MSFVGILCTPKQERYVKPILNSNLQGMDVIVLKEDTIQNFKNITFDTVAVFTSKLPKEEEVLQKIINKAKHIVINSDEQMPFDIAKNSHGDVITYGFNTKSTVTASSVKDDSVLICVQNDITDKIEPQEILVDVLPIKVSTSSIMGIASILLVYGKKESLINLN